MAGRIDDEALAAHLDGRTPSERLAEVEAALAADPDTAARLEVWRRNDRLLRAALAETAGEPVPARLLAALQPSRGARAPIVRRALVASLALGLLATGGATGWLLGRRSGPEPRATTVWRAMVGDAIAAHRLYAGEVAHPVEVTADGSPALSRWIAHSLGLPRLAVPDLGKEGYRLLGGRILPAGGDRAAVLMYEAGNGERVTIYIRNGQSGEAALRWVESSDVAAGYWVDDGCVYVVTAEVPVDRLRPLVRRAFDQFEAGVAG